MLTINGQPCGIVKEGKGKDVCYKVLSFNEDKIIAELNIPGVASESENIIALKNHGNNEGMLNLLERKGVVRSLLGFKRIKNNQTGDVTVPVIMIDQNRLLHL